MFGPLIALITDEVRRVWCHKWLALIIGVVIFCAGAAFVARMPPVYEAWAQIYVNRDTRIAAAAKGVSLVGDNTGSANLVARSLLNDQGLEQLARRLNPPGRPLTKTELGQTVGRLKRSIEVSPDQGDGFFEFHVKDNDPVRAQRIVQQLLNDFIAMNVGGGRDELLRASAFLDTQIAAYETMLAESRARMVQFEQQHPGLGLAMAAAPAAGGGDMERARMAYERALAQQPQTPARRSNAEDRVNTLQAKLDSLRLEYTEQHPDVLILKRQLAQAEADRDEQLRSSAGSGEALSPALRAARAELAAARRGGGGRTISSASPAVQSEWAELMKNDEVLRTSYQDLISRREAARMSQAADGADSKFQIIRRPTVPEYPVGPQRKLYLAAVALAAIGGGLGAAYLRAAIQGIFVSPRELEQAFELPVVGTISWEPAWSTAPPRGRPPLLAGPTALLGRFRRGKGGRALSKHSGAS